MSKDKKSIFEPGKSFYTNACLNFMHDMSYGYLEGYRLSGEILVNKIIETGKDQDFLVYPIVYLYRHYLELLLKSIINNQKIYDGNGRGHPTHHELHKLWPIVKGFIRKAYEIGNSEELSLIDSVVNDFKEFDPKAMSFRFAKGIEGDISNPELKHIDLRHLAVTIEAVGEYLEAYNDHLHYSIDKRNEELAGYDYNK